MDLALREQSVEQRNPPRRTLHNFAAENALEKDNITIKTTFEDDRLGLDTRSFGPYKLDLYRLLCVLSVLSQGLIFVGIFLSIVTAESWPAQHRRWGFSVLVLLMSLCAALTIQHKLKPSFTNSSSDRGMIASVQNQFPRLVFSTGAVLLLLLFLTVLTGWMCTLEFFWGILWLEGTHSVLVYITMAFLAIFSGLMLIAKIPSKSI